MILDMPLEVGKYKKIKNLQPPQTTHTGIPQILTCKQIKYSLSPPKAMEWISLRILI